MHLLAINRSGGGMGNKQLNRFFFLQTIPIRLSLEMPGSKSGELHKVRFSFRKTGFLKQFIFTPKCALLMDIASCDFRKKVLKNAKFSSKRRTKWQWGMQSPT